MDRQMQYRGDDAPLPLPPEPQCSALLHAIRSYMEA
jgi:hypothetical protein